MFKTLFWQIDTAYFDADPIEDWPQDHVGVVLWCLSVSAHDWMSPSDLTSICTPTYQHEPLNQWHLPEHAVASRILRPLTWLSLMESRRSNADKQFSVREYRKSPLFDRALKFDVDVAACAGPVH